MAALATAADADTLTRLMDALTAAPSRDPAALLRARAPAAADAAAGSASGVGASGAAAAAAVTSAAVLASRWAEVLSGAARGEDGWAAGDRLAAETAAWLRGASAEEAGEALDPLWRAAGPSEEEAVRRWYLSLLPPAVCARWAADTPAAYARAVSDYCGDALTQRCLRPLFASAVEPPLRELRYHFRRGRPTARRDHPQHFFSFLLELLRRQASLLRARWRPPGVAADGPATLAAAAVCVGAGAVFGACYGWEAGAAAVTHSAFNAVVVNALFTLEAAAAEGAAAPLPALRCLHAAVLVDGALDTYYATAAAAAAAALARGPQALWRRPLLRPRAPPPARLRLGTLRAVRCLEAVVRRALPSLLALEPAAGAGLWAGVVAPALAALLEAAEEECERAEAEEATAWGVARRRREVAACLQVAAAAADDWYGLLGGAPAGLSAAPTDALALARDRLTRLCAADCATAAAALCGPSAPPGGLDALDAFLADAEALPDGGGGRAAVVAAVRRAMQEHLTAGARSEARLHAEALGLSQVAAVLAD